MADHDLRLCRYRVADGEATRLGLMRQGQVYDLTATGRPEYTGMAAWLAHVDTVGSEAAVGALAAAHLGAPVCTVDDLLAGASGREVLAPIDAQEVWACGVTYRMSREARMRESQSPTIYGRVYEAERPQVFFKATPHRVVGPGEAVGIRADSAWNVPEPELTLLVTPGLCIAGYTVGNDMSSRDIEGQNPLYLPQAKVYDRCAALGPCVRLAAPGFDPQSLTVRLRISRGGVLQFQGETSTANIHRSFGEMVRYLGRCNRLPAGAFVMTGTGIVPPDSFTLEDGDRVEICIEGIGTLENPVVTLPAE